uniref:Uncharacterized protein n=1 Tax=Knipowitschia caucasica TaxID=637954 RepID=A0AAV2MN15_KNICA
MILEVSRGGSGRGRAVDGGKWPETKPELMETNGKTHGNKLARLRQQTHAAVTRRFPGISDLCGERGARHGVKTDMRRYYEHLEHTYARQEGLPH